MSGYEATSAAMQPDREGAEAAKDIDGIAPAERPLAVDSGVYGRWFLDEITAALSARNLIG